MTAIRSTHSQRDIGRTVVAAVLLLISTAACSAQRSAPPLVMASVRSEDTQLVTAFRALLDDVIGDSADKVCLSVAHAAEDGAIQDADPSASVMNALRRGPAKVVPNSTCAEDERNFGNPHGLLRLRDVTTADDQMLLVHAEVIGDHSARYECVVPRAPHSRQHVRCRITERDWPGSQKRG
jgi:hypothetical protein